jgi:hypothetical protein
MVPTLLFYELLWWGLLWLCLIVIRGSVVLRPSCHGSTHLQARQADPEALQRTQAVSWRSPRAPLWNVCTCS